MPTELHEQSFSKIIEDLHQRGDVSAPRGLKIIELTNYDYVLPQFVRFMNFKSRKLNVDYIKNEFLWYLKGDRFDTSITKYAKMWNDVMNPDGSINSNYGQYIFGEINQFDRVIETLKADKDSRRASIIILRSEHFNSTTDIPCTYAINFRIRGRRDGEEECDELEMTVRMRSQDAIYGMGSDAPIFSFVHEMVWMKLLEKYYCLELGKYYHSADSFHAYEKHFDMIEKICSGDEFEVVQCPRMYNAKEVDFLRKLQFDSIPDEFKFTKWLTNIS